jgi:UDP-glucose 4-epimerase
VFGDGLQTRAFSYIGDITPAITRSVLLPSCYGEIFNIGADEPYSILELAREVGCALGVVPTINHLPERNEVRHAYASHEKLVSFFGEQPKTSLAEGLRRMAAWVQKVGVREPVQFGQLELSKNLPPSWQ